MTYILPACLKLFLVLRGAAGWLRRPLASRCNKTPFLNTFNPNIKSALTSLRSLISFLMTGSWKDAGR
jgi:hypothetical protein